MYFFISRDPVHKHDTADDMAIDNPDDMTTDTIDDTMTYTTETGINNERHGDRHHKCLILIRTDTGHDIRTDDMGTYTVEQTPQTT